jgi:hypothetical protein
MVEDRMLALTVIEKDADRLSLANHLLGLRKRGMSYYACSREMGMTVAALKSLESECRDRVFCTISEDVQRDRELRIAQLDSVIERATLIAEQSYDYSERLAAENTIVKAIQAAARITGLESSPASVTNNTLNIANEQELLKRLANYHQSKNGKAVTEVYPVPR